MAEQSLFDAEFNPLDPVSVEITLFELDNAVEQVMKPYTERYRPQFKDPTVYDNFVLEHQMRMRKQVRKVVDETKAALDAEGYSPDDVEEPDDDGGV